ncbi:hypothetical protein JXB22_07215 [candidate division WOR-3 bacterium]|nr:hypothetical protein [candidate division WOR-3 bacterium]
MRIILLGIIACSIAAVYGEAGTEVDFSSPEATFNTFVKAVLGRDQDAAVECFAADLQAEMSDPWEEDELPDSVEFEVVDEYVEEAYAELEISIWDDLTEETVVETMYFVLEQGEWKMTWPEYDEPWYDYDTMGEDYEEW